MTAAIAMAGKAMLSSRIAGLSLPAIVLIRMRIAAYWGMITR